MILEKVVVLLLVVGKWFSDFYNEVLVFDDGYWQKSVQFYDSVMKVLWDVVILNVDMKKVIIDDYLLFYELREMYDKFKVLWKCGIIYYGLFGNGKMILIKVMMKMLYQLKEFVLMLYVWMFLSVSFEVVFFVKNMILISVVDGI